MFYCRVERVLALARTSVAPPERSARLSTAFFLPPAPTLSGSRTCVDREPEITTTCGNTSESEDEVEEVSDDEVEKVLDDEGLEENALDEELDNKVVPPLHFGPPKGRTKSVASQSKENINSNFFLYSTLSHLIIILVSNLPASERELPANGSSRLTGGILRGHALGNTPNIGDSFEDMEPDIKPLARGWINVTIVQQPPGDLIIENPTSHLKVMLPCYGTMAPLLKKVAKSYSPVRSKYFIR